MALKQTEPPAESGKRLVYGVNPVLESLRAHPDEVERLYLSQAGSGGSSISEIQSQARQAGIPIEQVPRERLAAMVGRSPHQGVVARLRDFRYAELGELMEESELSGRPLLAVALDRIQDPQNLGAIIRSAHALGAHGVVIPKDRSAQVTAAVAKASAGATEHCKVARVVNLSRALEEIKEAGAWVVAAVSGSGESLSQAKLDGPLALVIGGEADGIRAGVLKHCDLQVSIPIPGKIASLNASVAAGILLYEVARQRGSV